MNHHLRKKKERMLAYRQNRNIQLNHLLKRRILSL
nr:MAG TPA: hypothetical protein [Caudoviricetes sp.]